MSRRRDLRSRAALLALGWMLGAAGCASHSSYPQTFPPRLAGEPGCQGIAGQYEDRGFTAQGVALRLAPLLMGEGFRSSAVSVRLSLPTEGGLRLEVPVADGEPVSLLLTRRQAACHQGVLRIRAGATWVGNASQLGFWVGRESHSFELQAAAGALVVQAKTTTTGVLMVLPLTLSRVQWCQFQRVAPR
jgi:hypothetical protein